MIPSATKKGGREEGTNVKLRETVLWKESSEQVSSLVHGGVGVTWRSAVCLGVAFDMDNLLQFVSSACWQVWGVSCGCEQNRDLALSAAFFIGGNL